MLDNFPHIKAYWVMLGVKTAQIALCFGADDIDGTVVHEKIYHDGRLARARGADARRARAPDPRGRAHSRRARHALQRRRRGRGARRGAVGQAAASTLEVLA